MTVIKWPTETGGGGGGITKYANLASFPASASLGDLGIAQDTLLIYAWSGSAWVLIDAEPVGTAGGELSGTYPNPTVVASATTTADSLVRRDASGNVQGGTFNASALTADTVPYLDASKDMASSAVTPTELGYLSGVSSGLQTQLDAKVPYSALGVSNTFFVTKDGNDSTGDGSFGKPYLTIQAAVDAASSGDTVIVYPGSYTENVTISAKTLGIIGHGGYLQQRVSVVGKILITNASFCTLNNISINNGADYCLEISGGSNHRFQNCNFLRTTNVAVYISGVLTGGMAFDGMYLAGTFQNNASTPYPVRIINAVMPTGYVSSTNAGAYTLVDFCTETGVFTHSAGSLVLSNIRLIYKDGSGNCINSTASFGGVNFLGITNVNFQQEDITYGKINKTGTCAYVLGQCNRDTVNDVLTGVEVNKILFADDISANRTPTNYTAAASDIKSHFAGVDTALGGKEPTITTLAASKGGLGTDASAFTGVTVASSGVFSATTIPTVDAVEGSQLAATPSNPSAGLMRLYFKNDQKLYKLDPSGTETEIGAGGGGGGLITSVVAINSNTTLTDKALHLVDTTAARSLTLPAAASLASVVVKDASGSASTNNITVSPASGTIDGAASYVVNAAYESVQMVSDGTNWFVI